MDDLIFASVARLTQAIRSNEVSSLEVVQACLARIAEVNPKLNGVVALTAEAALEAAGQADAAQARGERLGGWKRPAL